MDDDHSRQQLDDLAELFLTSVVEPSKPEDTTRQADDPLEGPEPIRLAPKIQSPDDEEITPRQSEPFMPFGEPPKLRLTEEEPEPVAEQPNPAEERAEAKPVGAQVTTSAADPPIDANRPAPKALLEGVLMGNLPGMSGPWLTQYAQLLAQTDGPVAVLHVGPDEIDLELVEPRAESEPAPALPLSAVRIPPMRDGMSGLVGLLDALVTSELAPTRSILVRVDEPGDTGTLNKLAALEDWTVLCGSDDASVAGVVNQLQRLVRADPRLAEHNVALMVMGSDEPTAQLTADRVADQLGNDLVHRVELVGHLKRMQPVQVRDIGSFPGKVWPQLAAWLETLEAPELPESVEPAPIPEAAATPEPKPQTTPAPTKPASRPEPAPMFQGFPSAANSRAKPKAAPKAKPPREPQLAELEPKPATSLTQATRPLRAEPAKRVLAPSPELDLVALIGQGPAALDDPAPLDARLPDQPKTQLAVDRDGAVHILLQHITEQDPTSSIERTAIQLIEAGRWTREHLELLALTQRDVEFVDQDPVLHLLTDRPDQATRMISKLNGEVRLHLLQEVQVGKASGWFCTPLG